MIIFERFLLFHRNLILFWGFNWVLHLYWTLWLIPNRFLCSHRFIYLYRSLFLNWTLRFNPYWFTISNRSLFHRDLLHRYLFRRDLFNRDLFLFFYWFLKDLNLILLYPQTFFINLWWFCNRFIPFLRFFNIVRIYRRS